MKYLYTFFAFVAAIGIVASANAQQPVQRTCGHDFILSEAKNQNPQFIEGYDQLFEDAKLSSLMQLQDDGTYVIQVVFHILYEEGDPYQLISDELVISQIEALNRDFNKRNADTINTREFFVDRAGRANIKFVLAKKKGESCGNAIIKKQWVAPTNLLPIYGDFAVKNDAFGGSTAWNTNRYLNIWVGDLNKGRDPSEGFLGGYAFLPGLANSIPLLTPKAHDGVVIDYRFIGQNNPYITEVQPGFAHYSKGRTTVHEVGHWLGLRHAWGDLGSIFPDQGCSADDGVDDTPNSAQPYAAHGFCQDTIVNSCDDGPGDLPDMFENYMDYATDDCYTMFTVGQVAVFHETLNGYRAALQDQPLILPTTTTVTATVKEERTVRVCFELDECYGNGWLESFFCESDSTYASALGSAQLINGELCFDYTAGSFNESDFTDQFCLITYEPRFDEYDTTIVIITIEEQCPKVGTQAVEVTENTSETTCIEADDCLSGAFTLTFCNGSGTYSSDLLDATVDGTCIFIDAGDYNPAGSMETLCLVGTYTGNVKDTTYLDVTVADDLTSGIDLTSAKDNSIDIFPNPSGGLFTIRHNYVSDDNITISVFDVIGHQVVSRTIKGWQTQVAIDLREMPKGMYVMYFEGKDIRTFEKLLVE